MSGAEIKRLEGLIKELKDEVMSNTVITQKTFDTVNNRISNLEIAEAKRQGVESVTGSNKLDSSSIIKIAIAALGVAGTAVSLALLIAQKVMQ